MRKPLGADQTVTITHIIRKGTVSESYTAALRLSPPRLLIARTMEGTLQHLPAAGRRNRRAI